MIGPNLIIILVAFIVAIGAIYVLYSIILYQGNGKAGEELQLSTKNILEQVKVLFDKNEFALVELLASKYLDRVPSHVDVRIYLAKAYYENRKYNAAISQCQKILKKKPNSIETHLTLARCYQKRDFLNKAIREYEIVFESNKSDKDIVQTLAELYRDTDQLYMSVNYYTILVDLLSTEQEKADIYSILAQLNIDAHDYPAAFEAYKARLLTYPQDVDTNKKLAELYIKIGNIPVAIETLIYMTDFVTESKMQLWIYETLVDLYEQAENYDLAIEYSEKLLGLQGSDKFKVRNRIALFNLKLNRVGDGILILEDLAMMSQNGFEVTIELAQAYIQNKEYQKALERYLLLLDKAMQKEAKQVNLLISDLYITWACDEIEMQNNEKAIELLENAEQYNGLNPEIYYNISRIHFNQKNYSGVIEDIKQAIEYDKDGEYSTKYLLQLADAHHQLGNFFEEKKALTDLMRVNDKNPEGLLRLGIMYSTQNDMKNAEETLKSAIENDPEMIQAKFHLALLYESNNKDKAKELYMEILEQDPSFTEAKNALADLSSTNY